MFMLFIQTMIYIIYCYIINDLAVSLTNISLVSGFHRSENMKVSWDHYSKKYCVNCWWYTYPSEKYEFVSWDY